MSGRRGPNRKNKIVRVENYTEISEADKFIALGIKHRYTMQHVGWHTPRVENVSTDNYNIYGKGNTASGEVDFVISYRYPHFKVHIDKEPHGLLICVSNDADNVLTFLDELFSALHPSCVLPDEIHVPPFTGNLKAAMQRLVQQCRARRLRTVECGWMLNTQTEQGQYTGVGKHPSGHTQKFIVDYDETYDSDGVIKICMPNPSDYRIVRAGLVIAFSTTADDLIHQLDQYFKSEPPVISSRRRLEDGGGAPWNGAGSFEDVTNLLESFDNRLRLLEHKGGHASSSRN